MNIFTFYSKTGESCWECWVSTLQLLVELSKFHSLSDRLSSRHPFRRYLLLFQPQTTPRVSCLTEGVHLIPQVFYFYFLESFFFFLMWTIFKVFIEYVTISLLFHVLGSWDMWDLSSPTRDWTCTHSIGRWSLNHWTIREVPLRYFRQEKMFEKN